MKRLTYTALICTLLLLNGCAVFNRNNTPALNFIEKHLVPKENPARAISYPLVIPVGTVAATLDMFLFHPVSVVPESWDDTTDILWKKMDWDSQYATSAASLLPRGALTPVVFLGDFIFRSSFDIKGNRAPAATAASREEYTRRQEEKKKAEQSALSQAAAEMVKGNYPAAVLLADKALSSDNRRYDAAAIKASALLESGQLEALAAMPQYLRLFSDPDFVSRFSAQLTRASGADTLRLLSTLEKHNISKPSAPKNRQLTQEQQGLILAQERLAAATIKTLEHDDRAIRLRAIQVAGKRLKDVKELRPAIEKIAASGDPVLAFAAKEVLTAPNR